MTEGSHEAGAVPATVSNSPLPLRVLNEFAHCPRLGYLMWMPGEFADGAGTFRPWVRCGGGGMSLTSRYLAEMRGEFNREDEISCVEVGNGLATNRSDGRGDGGGLVSKNAGGANRDRIWLVAVGPEDLAGAVGFVTSGVGCTTA